MIEGNKCAVCVAKHHSFIRSVYLPKSYSRVARRGGPWKRPKYVLKTFQKFRAKCFVQINLACLGLLFIFF